ncbi:MAG: L,D-transpeptidase [Bacteroidota bacterium]|nr:L,D-transpeptidase [Bacteroidota bacterium]
MFRSTVRFFLCVFLFCILFSNDGLSNPLGNDKTGGNNSPSGNNIIQDTIYTQRKTYLEIDLSKQIAYLHFTDKEDYTFKVSTGNPAIEKGVKTPIGLFVIQSKATFCRSKQFDNVPLLNWMGFNNGIGFHALETSSYYRSLGRRPSSHGCVRVSREDSKEVFKYVVKGTPVLIHDGIPGLVVKFASQNENYEKPDYNSLLSIIKNRSTYLKDSTIAKNSLPKIIIDDSNIQTEGVPIESYAALKSKAHTKSLLNKDLMKKTKKVKKSTDSTKVSTSSVPAIK